MWPYTGKQTNMCAHRVHTDALYVANIYLIIHEFHVLHTHERTRETFSRQHSQLRQPASITFNTCVHTKYATTAAAAAFHRPRYCRLRRRSVIHFQAAAAVRQFRQR